MIPFEFTIEGPPVSLQAKPRSRVADWKRRVREAATAGLPPGEQPHNGPVRLLITYYYDSTLPLGDIDNIVKPIQDALAGVVYRNDRQVEHVDCARRDMNQPLRIKGISIVLASGFTTGREFLHVKIDNPARPDQLRQ